ncbi:hypothetical protein OROMI_033265 [Orobanche minor]
MFLILPFIERLPLSQTSLSLYHRLSSLTHRLSPTANTRRRFASAPAHAHCGVPSVECLSPARSCSHVAARTCFLSKFRPPPLSAPPPIGVPRPAPCPPAVQLLTHRKSQQPAPQQPLTNSTPRPSPSRSAGEKLRQETVDQLQLQLGSSGATTLLLKHTPYSGNFSTIVVQCLQKLPSNSSKYTYSCDGHSFNFLLDSGFVARCEPDPDVEVFESAEEGGDLGIVDDEVQDFGSGSFSAAQNVETTCVFPKNPLKGY